VCEAPLAILFRFEMEDRRTVNAHVRSMMDVLVSAKAIDV
jgi:hypothetical protein